MAHVLRLANIDQSDTIDLLNGTLKLGDRSWVTSSSRQVGTYISSSYGATWGFENYDPVLETMDLVGDDTASNLRIAFDDIGDVLDEIRRYHTNPWSVVRTSASGPAPWWLEWNSDGESAKRSLLYEGAMDVLQSCGTSPFLEQNVVLSRLSLSRHPFWETTSETSFSLNNLDCLGGYSTISNIPGNVPGRIQKLTVDPDSGTDLDEIWIGIREKGMGMSSFNPLWQCEDGNAMNGAGVQAVAGASGGSVMQVSSPAASLTAYWNETVASACFTAGSTDYHHYIGRYLVLLRCKVNAGTVGIQMRTGAGGGDGSLAAPAEMVFVDSTVWQLYPLGQFDVPSILAEGEIGAGFPLPVMGSTIYIFAQQVSGTTSTLDLDAVVLIPLSHFAHISDTSAVYAVGSDRPILFTHPNDVQATWVAAGITGIGGSPSPSFQDWYLPTGDSILVFAGTKSTASPLSQTVDLDFEYYPRWMIYRYGYTT